MLLIHNKFFSEITRGENKPKDKQIAVRYLSKESFTWIKEQIMHKEQAKPLMCLNNVQTCINSFKTEWNQI